MESERVSAHCQRVYRIVTRYGDEVGTVAHDDVFSLAQNAETTLFQRPHAPKMGIHRAGTPVDRLHGSHGDVTERSGDRESIFGIVRPTLPLRGRRNHGGFH